MSCVQLPEGGFRVVTAENGSCSVGVVQVRMDTARQSHIHHYHVSHTRRVAVWQCPPCT